MTPEEASVVLMTARSNGTLELPIEEEKKESENFMAEERNMKKQGSSFFRSMEGCEKAHIQYAKVGLDIDTLDRFKQLAASLVVEKETAMARSCILGTEKDIIMEESIECVPKNFLEEIQDEASQCGLEVGPIRIMSVGELLSLLEV